MFEKAMVAGEAAMRRGNFHAALGHFEDALSEDPMSALAHADLSLCLSRLNRRFGAEIEAERALSLDPDLAIAHIALGYAALVMGDVTGARHAVAEVRRLTPDDPNALELACSIAHWRRDGVELQQASTALLAREPESPFGTYMLSRAASLLGRGKEAEVLAREALREAPDDALGHEAIGWAFLAQGKHSEARQAAYNSLTLAPEDGSAKALLAAAALRSRPLTGWLFMGALWMMRSSERAFMTAALVFMSVTTLAGNILEHYEQNAAVDAINVISWALALVFLVSVLLLNRILERESRGVRLSREY